jgi:hypothetical protein
MFARKLEPQGPSTMGAGKVEAATESTMSLELAGPFIPGGVVTDTRPLGVMEGRCLGTGATPALAAAAVRADAPVRSARTRARSLPPGLDERLARLGIKPSRARTPSCVIVDIPL